MTPISIKTLRKMEAGAGEGYAAFAASSPFIEGLDPGKRIYPKWEREEYFRRVNEAWQAQGGVAITPLPHVDPWANGAGPAMWKMLHEYALKSVGGAVAAAWLANFAKAIPCGECRIHWHAILHQHPPDTRSSVSFFEWTVHAHNALNSRLSKPIMPVEEARKLYAIGGEN